MTAVLDLFDIQGEVTRAYARFGFFYSRYLLLQIKDGARGRDFICAMAAQVTTAATWDGGPQSAPRPDSTLNISFTYAGLKALGIPRASLAGFPADFVMGMRARREILGDDGPSHPDHWDPVWKQPVHVLVSINALSTEAREQRYQAVLGMLANSEDGVVLLEGHRGPGGALLPYQDGHVVFENGQPTSKEHFGYTDGIGEPIFEGLPDMAERVWGRGKQVYDSDGNVNWLPLETGEFLLGHYDEAHEYPPAPMPNLLSRNGTYTVYRKLHENVGSFNKYLEEQGAKYPGGKELLAAKFVGRWRDNGAPLTDAPDAAAKQAWDQKYAAASPQEQDRMLAGVVFDDDQSGAKCPFSAHIRRINPRAALEFGTKNAFDTPGALANRRRILRRGLPYGESKPGQFSDDGEHGIVIMMLGASIERQFEFVQQQWINYGNDFRAGNDKEILLGNHGGPHGACPSRAVLPVDPNSQDAPFFLCNIPRLVTTRGGDYFFTPSMTALRMIAEGTVDPT
ncbi:peroxidase [Massilia sp. W12]|uniref:Dyp-type peroxidase n=1 Tax=Massilia sp. W12 TaxID=3126507 RepID=UPI0030D0B6F4